MLHSKVQRSKSGVRSRSKSKVRSRSKSRVRSTSKVRGKAKPKVSKDKVKLKVEDKVKVRVQRKVGGAQDKILIAAHPEYPYITLRNHFAMQCITDLLKEHKAAALLTPQNLETLDLAEPRTNKKTAIELATQEMDPEIRDAMQAAYNENPVLAEDVLGRYNRIAESKDRLIPLDFIQQHKHYYKYIFYPDAGGFWFTAQRDESKEQLCQMLLEMLEILTLDGVAYFSKVTSVKFKDLLRKIGSNAIQLRDMDWYAIRHRDMQKILEQMF